MHRSDASSSSSSSSRPRRNVSVPQRFLRDVGEDDSDEDEDRDEEEAIAHEFAYEIDENKVAEAESARIASDAAASLSKRRRSSSSSLSSSSSSSSSSSVATSSPWEPAPPNTSTFEVEPWNGAEPFADRLRPSVKAGAADFEPIDWFKQFCTQSMVDGIVERTNKYVSTTLPARATPPWWRHEHWPPKWCTSWAPLTADELYVYIGIMIHMILVRLPRIVDYWVDDFPFNAPLKGVMARNRFKAIRSALHFADDNDRPAGASVFWKVEWLLDKFRERCEYVSYPGREVSLDEEMILCLSRYASHLTQRVKNKPIDLGFLVRSIVCARSKYLRSFMFIRRGTVVAESALALARQLPRSFHIINLDNLYSRPSLFKSMLGLPFPQYANGTWRGNYECPDEIKALAVPVDGRNYACMYNSTTRTWGYKVVDGGNAFYLLSSAYPPHDAVSRRRASGQAEPVERNLGNAVAKYNADMGGVDADDQMRAAYTTKRRDYKWTGAVFSWVIDRAALQGYVCHRETGWRGTHEAWLNTLVKELYHTHGARPSTVRHLPVSSSVVDYLPDSGGVCVRCSARVTTYCTACRKYLCISKRSCFFEHHTQN